jgi:hypothetical protein
VALPAPPPLQLGSCFISIRRLRLTILRLGCVLVGDLSQAGKHTTKAEIKKTKFDKLLPYRSRLCSYMQINEDTISRQFKDRMSSASEGERDYMQIAHYRLSDAMDERRREIGADPEMAQSFEKVWERVERRTNRMHKLDGGGSSSSMSPTSSSSGSFVSSLSDSYSSSDLMRTRPACTISTTSSLIISTSTEITDDDTGADTDDDDDSFVITDDSCLSEKTSPKGSSSSSKKVCSSRRSPLAPASPRNRSKSMGDVNGSGASARAVLALRSDSDSGSSSCGANNNLKLVFKCWRNNKRKIFTVPAKGITYVKFILFLYKKLEIESNQPLRLCHRAIDPSSGSETKLAVTDDASFKSFLAHHGTAKDATTTYSLWVE